MKPRMESSFVPVAKLESMIFLKANSNSFYVKFRFVFEVVV